MNSYEITVTSAAGALIYRGNRMTTSDATVVVRDLLTSEPECRRPGAIITVTVR